jgi:hypothetical protein
MGAKRYESTQGIYCGTQDGALLRWLVSTPEGFQPGTSRILNVHLTTQPYRPLEAGYNLCTQKVPRGGIICAKMKLL